MKHNLKNNLLTSITFFLSFGIHTQSLSLSSTYSIESMNLRDLSLIPSNQLNNTIFSKISLTQIPGDLTPRHGIQLSCELTNSYTHQFNQHIEGIRVGLTPQQIRKIIGMHQEQRTGQLDNLCATHNCEYALSSPTFRTLLNEVKNSLIASYKEKESQLVCVHRKTKLSQLSAQIKFVDSLLSGKASELLKQMQSNDIHIAENAFYELQQLWPYEHEGSFLDPRSHTKQEKQFIEQINVDVMKTAEAKLLANPSYIEKYASQKSFQQIERFTKDCIFLQRQGNREALYHEVEKLLQQVKINGKREDFVTNVCLAIAIDKLTAPITSFLDKIVHAPDLGKSRELVNYLNKAIKDLAHQNNIFRQSEITEILIDECGFDPRMAANECYISHQDYIMMQETGRCYNPVEYVFNAIEKQDLSTAYNELIHIKQQLAELFESRNITDPIEQQNLLIEHFNEDIATKAHACYTARSDVLNIAKFFTPIDVQSTTVRILKSSPNTQSLATELQTVADVVLDNARLCHVACVPHVEECIVDSLKVLRNSNNIAETIFHTTVVDHLLTDVQTQSHSIATGTLPTWQRSSELFIKGVQAFAHGIDPIQPAIDLGVLAAKATYFVGKGTLDFIVRPDETKLYVANTIATTTSNTISAIVHTAKFICDVQYGDLYLPHDEYVARCNQFAQIIEPLDHITTDHIVEFSAYTSGVLLSPWAIAKAYTRLNQIDAIGKISNEVKVFARGIKNIIQEHPSFVTAEGIVLKMDSEINDVGKSTINTLYNVVNESVISKYLKSIGDNIWQSPAGLIYKPDPKFGNRVNHVLAHGKVNHLKKTHTVFNLSDHEILKLIDEAWLIRKEPLISDPGTYIINMKRCIGTCGESAIRLVTIPGTSEIITAYPVLL